MPTLTKTALKACSAVLLATGLFTMQTAAQSTFATLTGTVKDTSGAVLPDTLVTLTEIDTNIASNTKSDGSGNYWFRNVPPGRYTVGCSSAGFQDFKTEVFALAARQEQRADVTLALATSATAVEVVAAPPLINTETGSVTDALPASDLINGPLNYRTINTSPFAALYIMPEVIQSSGGPDGRTATEYNIQGASWNWTDVSVDGIFVRQRPPERRQPGHVSVSREPR